jgi:hypothetical protein
MDVCRISDLTPAALDLDPWGVCTPLGTLNVLQNIPPMESTTIWLKTIISSNDEMGQKDLSGSALKLYMQRQMSV